jgi:hypothetical protein
LTDSADDNVIRNDFPDVAVLAVFAADLGSRPMA